MSRIGRHLLRVLWLAPLLAAPLASAQSVTARLKIEPGERLYVNQMATLTLVIESRGMSLSRDFRILGLPEQSELVYGQFRELAPRRAREDDQLVETRRFRSKVRIPKPGTLTLSLEVKGDAVRYRGARGSLRMLTPFRASTQALELHADPLPAAGRPTDFDGAVGTFQLVATVTPTNVAPGDLVTLRTRLAGEGSLEGASPPEVASAPHFRVYPPQPVTVPDGAPPVYEQTLIPQSTNATAVPPITKTYFDPQARRYRTAHAGPFPLTFHKRERERVERFQVQPPEDKAPAALQAAARSAEDGRWSAATRKTAAQAGYWIVALSLMGLLAAGRGQRRRRWLVTVLVFLLSAALYVPYRNVVDRLAGSATAVPLKKDVTARVAPGSRALATFEMAAGSRVEVEESREAWVRVAQGVKRGWIPAESLEEDSEPEVDRSGSASER